MEMEVGIKMGIEVGIARIVRFPDFFPLGLSGFPGFFPDFSRIFPGFFRQAPRADIVISFNGIPNNAGHGCP